MPQKGSFPGSGPPSSGSLGRTVNYTLMSAGEFKERRAEKEGFIARLLSGQRLAVLGDADEVR